SNNSNNRQMQMIGGNGGNQFRQYAGQNAGNLNGHNEVQNVRNQVAPNPRVQNVAGNNGNQIRCYNYRGFGHYARNCTARPRRRDVAYLQTQLLIAQKEEAGSQLQAEEYDLMAAVADLDEIEEEASSSGVLEELMLSQISSKESATNLKRGFGHYARNCTARPRRRDAVYLQTQLLIAQKEEAGI
nr:hypothetical protein [Tanacetum cinerariifolium]